MATTNPFDLLGDNDNEDPVQLIAALPKEARAGQGLAVAAQNVKPAKLPSKPLPPAQAVREAKSDYGRGGSRGGGRGFGRGGNRSAGGFNRDSFHNENPVSNNGFSGGFRPSEDGDGVRASERRTYNGPPRGSFRGGRRGGFNDGEAADEERPRTYNRHSGTGRGHEIKRDGAGRGNWGAASDGIALETEDIVAENEKNVVAENEKNVVAENEKNVDAEKQLPEDEVVEANKENIETEEKEPEDKEMTLEEYEKVVEEKRKILASLKSEERKVTVDKEFKTMQQLSSKKDNNDVFIKLGSEKEKRKDAADKEEKAKKPVSINVFLKPAEGEMYFNPNGRGRGRGRGRGSRDGYSGGGSNMSNGQKGRFGGGGGDYRSAANNAPAIEDPGQFPLLGAK